MVSLSISMEKLVNKIKTSIWAFKLAWKIDKKMLLLWLGLCVSLSVLPAVALSYNREIIAYISNFISSSTGTFDDVIQMIVLLGVILTAIGLSTRINSSLIYMIMYDSYYLGIEALMMDCAQNFEIADLVKSETRDEYQACMMRSGSLTDFISAFCELAGKAVAITSLLIVAYSTSKVVFFMTIIYVIGVLILNSTFVDKLRVNMEQVRRDNRRAAHFEKVAQNQGIAKEIRIFETEDAIVKQWEKAFNVIEKFEKNRVFGLELRTFISSIGFYLFLIIMVIFSIFEVAVGRMSPDIFLIIYLLCLNISTAVTGVTKAFMRADYGLYALERQRRLFVSTPEFDRKQDSKKSITLLDENICFEGKGLSFGYKEGESVLHNLNFKIKKGETIALVGYNGSGKTTLVKLLLGLYKPTSGQLYFHGRLYDNYRRGFINSRIGAFFQDYYLFHFTLAENVGFGDVANVDNEQKILDAIKKGGAKKMAEKLPNGKDTLLRKKYDKTGTELSGGQKQRVAVSRTHMSDKEIMIFDEPAAMLDPIAEMEQFRNIREKLEGRTAILISHRVGFARLADCIYVMDKGQIVEQGTHEELIAENGVYADFYNQQAKWYYIDAKPAIGGMNED